ncbi:MAG: hypothetical protein ACRD30_07140, partial [Bryobacteraceae bacterium]
MLAYASLQAGSPEEARKAAQRAVDASKSPGQSLQARQLLGYLKNRDASKIALSLPPPDAQPGVRPPRIAQPSISGRFISLECDGKQAKVILQTAAGTKIFLIEDPKTVLVNGKNGETVDLTCGPQKSASLRITYDQPGPGRAGIDGLVRAIQFE